MPEALNDSLIELILKNDFEGIESLLAKKTGLASGRLSKPIFVESVVHWFYAGDTALHFAAAAYRTEIIDLLLKAGADPRSAENHRGGQPLHYAADGHRASEAWNPARQVRSIKILHRAGAILEAQDKNGATPLHRAVRCRCAEAVQVLLQLGSDPAARNESGSTAFHLAVQNTGRGGSGEAAAKLAQGEIIRMFVAAGVSSSLRDAKGKSVLEAARSEWVRELLESN